MILKLQKQLTKHVLNIKIMLKSSITLHNLLETTLASIIPIFLFEFKSLSYTIHEYYLSPTFLLRRFRNCGIVRWLLKSNRHILMPF